MRLCMLINKGPPLARFNHCHHNRRLCVTYGCYREFHQTYTCANTNTHIPYTHTHALVPLSIMFAQGTPTGPPPTPHPPSLLLLLPPPSCPSFLPFFDSVSFFRSISPAFPSLGGRVADQTCNNMPASPPLVSPFTPLFCLVCSVFICPSIIPPPYWSSLSIWLARWPCVFAARLPQSFVKLRYISAAHSAPVCRMTDYTSAFVLLVNCVWVWIARVAF